MHSKIPVGLIALLVVLGCRSNHPDSSSAPAPSQESIPPIAVPAVEDPATTETLPVAGPTSGVPNAPGGPIQIPPVPEGSFIDATWLTQMRSVAKQLESLAVVGRSETGQYIDSTDVGSDLGAAETLTREWNLWAQTWIARLLPFGSILDSSVPSVNVALMLRQELYHAFIELKSVTTSGGATVVPSKAQRVSHFDLADTHLRTAREVLKKLEQ